MTSHRSCTRGAAVLTVCLAFAWLTSPASAQERASPTIDLSAGWVGFADDGVVGEGLIGVAGRIYLSPRVAVGPELVYIAGDRHSHLVLTGNVTFDFVAPAAGRPPGVTPFLVVGGGLFQTRESFFGADYTASEGAFTAGGGIRAAVSDRVTLAVDARVGWETHIRIGGVVGVRVGR
jgi:hypothetical protein